MSKRDKWELVGVICTLIGNALLAFCMWVMATSARDAAKAIRAMPPTAHVEVTSEGGRP